MPFSSIEFSQPELKTPGKKDVKIRRAAIFGIILSIGTIGGINYNVYQEDDRYFSALPDKTERIQAAAEIVDNMPILPRIFLIGAYLAALKHDLRDQISTTLEEK